MRVLITGDRDFADREWLLRTFDQLNAERPITLLLHGGARGADRLGGEWARQNDVRVLARPADWKRFGRGAGLIRNRQMLEEAPDVVVACPGGHGTANMVKLAHEAGIEVVAVE